MTAPPTAAPTADKRAHEHTEHGVRRPDPYFWLREVDSPEVLAHLTAERSWYDAATGHLDSLIETLRSEMAARTPPTDSSVSYRYGNRYYYTRIPAGREYSQLLRDLNIDGTSGEILLDLNVEVGGGDYIDLGLARVSPDGSVLAFSVDLVGEEVFRLRFRDLETGQDLPDEVERSYYGGAWSADSRHFFYTVHDEAYRPFQVWRHELGTATDRDVLVLEETDERFELNVRGTRSGGLVVLWASSRDTSEVWVVQTADPQSPPRSVGGRRQGVEYHAEHLIQPDGEEVLLIATNDGAEEFRLVLAPVPLGVDQDHTIWIDGLPTSENERLERVDAFAGHVVLSLRVDGQTRLRVVPLAPESAPGPAASWEFRPRGVAGSVSLGPNAQYDANSFVVAEHSYLQPDVWFQVDFSTGERTVRLREDAPGHDPTQYACEERSFPAPDGTEVPATILRRRDTALDGTAPALVYGYGAYESSLDAEWDTALPSLLDRGVVYVVAHVRGGGEGGRRWWLEGHLEHKQNTFSDHVAVADGLVAEGLVDGSRLASRGLSAGGLLQGAVFSQRPDRWRAVVAEVPFVDVVTTMFDASIPLTINEWDEWGDPRRKSDFDWMLAYSPYDNLPPAGGRPDLLVTGALHDPRVMVWEPAKWVAALRDSDPEWSPRCLFRCELGAGAHVGPSGRFAHLSYEAEIYAWVLERLKR